jgi:hypothetical protein
MYLGSITNWVEKMNFGKLILASIIEINIG